MPILNTSEVALNYQTFGDATRPALIFSNSLGTNYSMWQAQIDYFKQNYYVICYDTRGHGASSTPQGPYSLEQLGHDVIALLDHLNIEKASFCGISMGGLTGQWLAINFPARFNHVIICNTAAKIGQEKAWRDRAYLVRTEGLRTIAQTAATRWFTAEFIENEPQIIGDLSTQLANSNAEGYASCCEALATADLREDIKNISIAVLVIAGQQDPVTTVLDGEYLRSRIKNSQLYEINASHISNIEKINDFNTTLAHFIQ